MRSPSSYVHFSFDITMCCRDTLPLPATALSSLEPPYYQWWSPPVTPTPGLLLSCPAHPDYPDVSNTPIKPCNAARAASFASPRYITILIGPQCDKARPECSQCVRAGKQCPGYRDQLSLMFRDESTKVIQKAHAQWGVPASSDSQSPSSGSPSSSSSPFSFVNSDGSPIATTTPVSRRYSSVHQALIATSRLPKPVEPTVFEKGMQFYVDRYVLGYPQEVQTPTDLQDTQWISTPEITDIMAAVGLSALSNLTGNVDMEIAARQKYGLVLRSTAKSLQNPAALALDPRTAIRKVVLLTMFEVVQGTSEVPISVRAHIMGAAALLTSLVPNLPPSSLANVFRGIVQLCFSMVCIYNSRSTPSRSVTNISSSSFLVTCRASMSPNLHSNGLCRSSNRCRQRTNRRRNYCYPSLAFYNSLSASTDGHSDTVNLQQES